MRGADKMFGALGDYEERAKAAKRAKQEDYSRALKEQQLLHQQKEAEALLHKPKEPFHSFQPGAQAQIGGEWTMGPLGVPVRKVLEVGDRGRQKASTAAGQQPPRPSGAEERLGGRPAPFPRRGPAPPARAHRGSGAHISRPSPGPPGSRLGTRS